MIIAGHYQYPGCAAREAARLVLSDSDATLTLETPEGSSSLFALAQVTVSDALGSIPLTLTFSDGGRFVPEDDAAFRGWVARHQRSGLVHRLERQKRGVALILLATVLAVLGYVYVVLPWVSAAVAMHFPAVVEQQVGKHTLTLLEHSDFKPSALPAAQQQELQQLFAQTIPPRMRQDRTPPRLMFMAAPIGPNAFMLADGTLVVSDDLVKLAQSYDALAAVMLHEMGHHAYRHPMRMLVRSSLVSLTFMWMIGDVSGVGDTLLQSAAFVNELQFSRSMEREADAWAIAEMQRQGRSLQAMEDIYQALATHAYDRKQGGLDLPDWLSTHPAMEARLEMIKAKSGSSSQSH